MNTAPIIQPKQHIASTPGVCGGKPCVAGTRVRVWDIAVRAQAGQSPDEILAHFPQLTLSDVHAALAYYYDNRAAIDDQATQDDRFAEQLRQSAGSGPLEKKLGEEAGAFQANDWGMKFHADENISEAVVLGLVRRGLDVSSTPQAGLLSATDAEQLAYCRREGRTLISHDADMLRLAAVGTPHSGIAYCHNQKYKTGELISRLLALSGRVSAEEMQNQIEFL